MLKIVAQWLRRIADWLDPLGVQVAVGPTFVISTLRKEEEDQDAPKSKFIGRKSKNG